MTADLYQTILTAGAAVNLSARAKWRLSGGDRVRYLNGQVTNDVRTARSTEALYACVTNVKGKIEGDIFVHASPDGESLLIDANAALRDHLGMRLERYIIADDAVLEDITEEWQLWHLIGSHQIPEGGHRLTNPARFGILGTDVWLPASVTTPGLTSLTEDEAETLRIVQKVPAYPHELNPEAFPQEAGLETQAMSFTKGCYIGQEILSRIKTSGKMPRQLIAWGASRGNTPQPGETIQDETGKDIGQITSVTAHPATQAPLGLAYVKQSATQSPLLKTASGVALSRAI